MTKEWAWQDKAAVSAAGRWQCLPLDKPKSSSSRVLPLARGKCKDPQMACHTLPAQSAGVRGGSRQQRC
jgi:hypothetical protein